MQQAYFAVLLPLLALDGIWLGLVSSAFYRKYLGHILAERFTLWPAAIFYPLYAFGILVFAVTPALSAGSVWSAFFRGALLGLVAYGAYDLTNQATLARWPITVTLVDLAWGTLVTATVSAIAYLIVSKL